MNSRWAEPGRTELELESSFGLSEKDASALDASRPPGAEVPAPRLARRLYEVNQSAPVAGTDGVTNKVDDRVLLSGGGSDGRFAGAGSAAPTSEIILPPSVFAPDPVGPETPGKDAQSAFGRGGEVAFKVESLESRPNENARLSAAPGTPLHYARNLSEAADPAAGVTVEGLSAEELNRVRGGRVITGVEEYRALDVGGGAGGGQAPPVAEDYLASGATGGAAGAYDALAGKPASSELAAALTLESAAPSPRRTAPSTDPSRLVDVSATRKQGEPEAKRSGGAPPNNRGANPSPERSIRARVVNEAEVAGVPALEQQVQQQLGEIELRRLNVNQVDRNEKLHENESLAKSESRDKDGYYYKRYDEATKAAAESPPAADQQNQQGQPAVELATRFVAGKEVAEQLADGVDAPHSRPATPPAVDARKLVEDYCQRLVPQPGETPDMMFFRYWGTNPFVEANVDDQSTFAVDVDTASYTLLRKYLTDRGVLPPREAIRTEEFLNYFDYEYAPPPEGQTFAVHTEMAPSPFGHEPEYQLLKVGVKGREVTSEKRQRCALVFVVDTSGSMARESRLELVKDGLRLLVREVDEGDTIGIAAFDREARTILEPTPADQKEKILDAISTLEPRRNTNVDAGLTLGYQMAAANLVERGTNRVLLLSDGVANTGVTDVDGMLANVRAHRQRGIFLTCVGVGMGNHNDTLLEQLADRGDGQCVYVDRVEEARKVFVENLAGTLETIARDVKIQVEFDREKVLRYRLLGYENRAVADSAFRDDTVDAGEVGAGHQVTALYELKCAPSFAGRIATVRVRHLKVDSREPVELEHVVDTSSRRGTFADASPRFKLGALAAEFAEILRDSYWARGGDPRRVAAMTQDLLGEGGMKLGADPEVVELAALMFRAAPLIEARRQAGGELAQVMDALKENTHLRARVEDLRHEETFENTSYLRDLQQQNDELRRRLERLLDQRISGGE